MANYSVTLNFFVPKEIVEALKQIKASGAFVFDLRKTDLFHCTVKAIALCDDVPEDEVLNQWAIQAKSVLDEQKQFTIRIRNIAKFPTALYAGVESEELLTLHRKLCSALSSSQPQFEDENYVPHVSIALLNQDIEIISNHRQDFGGFQVEEIQLLIWDLRSFSVSKIFHRFALAQPAP